LTITSSVFQNLGFRHISQAVKGLNFSSQDIHAALAGAKNSAIDAASPEVREAILVAIVKAIHDGWILVIVSGAVLIVCSLFMKWEKLFLEPSAGG
jgi:hypothetical protein